MDHNSDSTELLALLAQKAETLRSSEGWTTWLKIASRFHNYSVNNQLLIMIQRPDATRVAGYRAWQSLGRQVMRGEKAIRVLAPCFRRVAEADTGEATPILSGFRLVSVFDIAQTTGDELPEMEMPQVADTPAGLYDQLLHLAETQWWDIETAPAGSSAARGWWNPKTKRITIVEGHSLPSRTRTLLHEICHGFDFTIPGQNNEATRAERELIAESAAFITGTELGMNMADASAFYVTSWGGDTQSLQAIATRVLAVAETLRDSLADSLVSCEVAA